MVMNVATPQSELYEKLLAIGWSLRKIEFKNGVYNAKASNETTGQEIERAGKSAELALAAVYRFAQNAYAVRRRASLEKIASWTSDWLDQKEEIAQAYSKMPVFDDKAVPAWKALAAESKVQADAIRQQITVEVSDEPEPYHTAAEMVDDIHKNKHFIVSRANAEHPIWNLEDTVNFRIVHDVLGYGQSGGDFSWRGENLACGVHFPLVSPLAREALFTDCIGQAAYRSHFRGFGPQKIGFLSKFLHPAQEREGEHIWVPHGGLPQLSPSPNGNQGKDMLDQAAGLQGVFNTPLQAAPPSPTFGMPTPVMQPFTVKTHEVEWHSLDDWVSVESSSARAGEHVGMPVARPQYVDSYLEGLAGPEEQHGLGGHCVNPKCNGQFDESLVDPDGTVECPSCQTVQNINQSKDSPGGMTRAGLTMEQMGGIGEALVLRMGELPGIGAIIPASDSYNHPIDVIVQGQKGKFGCEIKTNHSQAQERFKIGGKVERQGKIVYCVMNGLRPALIGVRLNFFTDKAYIFFREGFTDTWIGNDKMLHVATLDFADLNPYKSPDPQAQALAVDNAHLPDQSLDDEDEFGAVFGSAKIADVEQPRDESGKFTFKEDVHELKTINKSGQHTHNVRRCKSCGHLNHVPAGHKSRVECSTCGTDPDRVLHEAKVRLAGPDADEEARRLGFQYIGRNARGHRQYVWEDESGTKHPVAVGSGAHGKRAAEIDAERARQRMTRCISGNCLHRTTETLPPEDEPGAPVIRAGSTVKVNDREHYVMEVDGGLALVLDTQTGEENIVPTIQLRAATETDWARSAL